MDYWKKVEEEISLTQENTTAYSATTWGLLRETITHYAEAFPLAKPIEEPKAAPARMGLVSQNFNSLKVAVDLAMRGYYIQSIILLRNVYENWLAFWYLAKFPDEADLWLDPRWDRRPPSAETMKNNIDHPTSEAKSKLHGLKQELDRFAHTDPVAVLSRLRTFKGQTVVSVGVEYRAMDFDVCAYSILLWSGNMLDAISSWIPSTHDWNKKYQLISDKILEFIKNYDKN